jgi:hypothetical protein
MAETTYGQWALTTNKKQGSRLSNLTSGTAAGKIKYITSAGGPVSAAAVTAGASTLGPNGVTGIVFPIGKANMISDGATLGGAPFSDATKVNMIGDPNELSYSLTTGDLFTKDGQVEKDGGAQKVVNAILDTAYVAYNSGVQLGSGLSSMTISRGDLALTSSVTTGISGVVNTYSRNYSVTFAYKQSGMMVDNTTNTAALPDISNDLVGEDGAGPF